MDIHPSLDRVRKIVSDSRRIPAAKPPNLVPIFAVVPGEFLTPSSIYLKVSAQSKLSFLLESAATTETIGRFSFIGAEPRKVIKTGPGHGPEVDPLIGLEDELSECRVAPIEGLQLPPLTGGAIGYVGYDCVKYFEPRTKRDLKDVVGVPESLFMMYDTVVAYDHFFQTVKVITYVRIPDGDMTEGGIDEAYESAQSLLRKMINVIEQEGVPLPEQGPVKLNQEFKSNIGQAGYEAHVLKLKEHICLGNIIQAVPSQRVQRPTSLHPFNVYRELRRVNPSPYLFYLDCDDFQIVGASPELLVKIDDRGRIVTHPIAGTVKRGATAAEDDRLAEELSASTKDRAEHVMLVDLARNDVNRVCEPDSTQVERLMTVERFSHVQHLVSAVSGRLRPECSRFDAFRSIFPAGTVSGAPKVRAMELIGELEREKRGVYGGAVGYFGYEPAAMDTCIALRTMVVKDGMVYLQAGGGVVYDSDPADEWVETLNKLGANQQCIADAERRYSAQPA